jgi:hypothetical protein
LLYEKLIRVSAGSWFAWANSVYAQTILDIANRKPHLIFGKDAKLNGKANKSSYSAGDMGTTPLAGGKNNAGSTGSSHHEDTEDYELDGSYGGTD